MLMEDRKEISHGTVNVKKTESLDVNRGRNGVSSSKKRSSGSSGSRNNGMKRKRESEERNVVKKKSKKEVKLSSLSTENKSKKSVESGKVEAGLDHRGNGGCLGDPFFKLNGDVSIPKRPRDLVRRKKVEVDVGSKQEGFLIGRASSGEGVVKCNGDENLDLHQTSNGNGTLSQNGESERALSDGIAMKVKKNQKSNDPKDNRSNGSDLLLPVKKENSHSSVNNGDSLTKKTRKDRKKKDNITFSLIKEVKGTLGESSRICEDSPDDEENLEANAARMLSSRFDPSCTVFSPGGKSSVVPLANGSSGLSAHTEFAVTGPTCRDESDIASTDGDARALRSGNQKKGKGFLKRYYYEVLSKDLDSYWVLNRRIKVFWPLDKSWYFGHVTGYDPGKKLHHIKYDDREEEWINLQSERFMLLLLPNEVPGKVGRKQANSQGKHSRKGKSAETVDKEQNGNSYMESEPIISWLNRSTLHKSPSGGIRKKQRNLLESAKVHLNLISEERFEPGESLEVGSSGRHAENVVCALPDQSVGRINGGKVSKDKFFSNISRSPIVYFRKRKRDQQPTDVCVEELYQPSRELSVIESDAYVDSADFEADLLLSMVNCGHLSNSLSLDEFMLDSHRPGHLKWIIPDLKSFPIQWNFQSPFVSNNLFRGPLFMFLLQHGTLISVWPMVHLEILLVDNTVGLRFLLFEGSLLQAVSFVSLVLVVFQSNQKENFVNEHLPVTSIRFRLMDLQGLGKQLVYALYNFSQILNSKWSSIDRKLSKHCTFSKQLPPSECTYDHIKALRNSYQLPFSCERSSVLSIQNKHRLQRMTLFSKQSAHVQLSSITCDSDEKVCKFPPFALSFAAAPTFFVSLHLKLLMGHCMSSPNFVEEDPLSLMDYAEKDRRFVDVDRCTDNAACSSVNVGLNSGESVSSSSQLQSRSNPDSCYREDLNVDALKPSNCAHDFSEMEVGISPLDNSAAHINDSQHLSNNHLSVVDTEVACGAVANMTIDIPSPMSSERLADAEMQNNQHPSDSALDSNDDVMHTPTPTPRSMLHISRIGYSSPSTSVCLSPTWTDRKQDFLCSGFGSGPKKPRTQVSYSMPHGGNDHNSKNKFHHGKGFRRIRRASEKKASGAGKSQRNFELLSCDVNVLVTVGDRGWRECGAKVMLEPADHNEWRLAVKLLGDTKYSYKAHQFLQPGSTNRYTHAMMWKGGKDWSLEFTDRAQWTTFKEMHEECYNRNLRAASVKNIPIPGVRLVEENDDIVPEVPYMRPSSKYYRQVETDIEIAMNPSRILYDMDSDDEQWVMKRRGLDFNERGCGYVSDEMFEKTMDAFEKFAFAKQRDHFSLDELEEAMAGLGPLDAIIIIYEHWREKRQKRGMPLIRHLQPPLWERYQQQVKEWECVAMKSNPAPSSGCSEKSLTIEKPAMFAFCLKPRGLEAPNRGSKHRPQRRLPVGALSNGFLGDAEYFHSLVGRRLNGYGLGDDRAFYSAYNQGISDSSPVLQGASRAFYPRDVDGLGYFSLNADGFDRNHYAKLHRSKSKKLCIVPPSNDHQAFGSYSQRTMGNRTGGHMWNMGSSEWPTQMHYQSDGYQRHNYEHLDPSELDEFRLRDAASAARHAVTIAKMKRENAQRMLCLADSAMHKAVAAIMTAEAVKASYEEPNDDVQMSG